MVLNSGLFLLFLSVVCISSYLFPSKIRYVWLLFCSYAFYLYDPVDFTKNIPAAALLLFATFFSYSCSFIIHYSRKRPIRKFFFILSVTIPIGFLFLFKYLNFFLLEISTLFSALGGNGTIPTFSLLLPLGISYYTLQAISYSFDVYNKKTRAERNFFRYALYMSFFPGIVVGPINRAGAMLPQYKNPVAFNYSHVSGGLFRVLWGLFKKMVVADTIHLYTSAVFAGTQLRTSGDILLASLLFSYQLYADFSGSCDIAIGSAKMLGFTFMENFNRPFAAKTFADLWRRWHISLTSFFRDYMYIPLGGSRAGRYRTIANIFVVFLVSGLWHGASFGYIVWGFMNAVILVVGKLFAKQKNSLAEKIPLYRNIHIRGFFQRFFVYLLFSGCMLFFAASLFNTSVLALFSAFLTGGLTAPHIFWANLNSQGITTNIILVMFVGIVVIELLEYFAVTSTSTIANWIRNQRFFIRWPLYYLLIIALLVFGIFGKSSFIYQQY